VSDADNSLPPSGQTLSQALKSLVATFDAQSIRYRDRLDLNSIRSDFQTVAEANDARWVKFESWVSELWNEQK